MLRVGCGGSDGDDGGSDAVSEDGGSYDTNCYWILLTYRQNDRQTEICDSRVAFATEKLYHQHELQESGICIYLISTGSFQSQ